MKIKSIRKINRNVVRKNGTVVPFQKQVISLISGEFDTRFPLIISTCANNLKYIGCIDEDKPLVMNVSTFVKLQNRHSIELNLIFELENLLKDNVLAFESLTQKTSVVILSERLHTLTNDPIVIVIRYDKSIGCITINEITSIYDKQRFTNFLVNTFNENKKFYKNKKTEHYVHLHRLQLPQELSHALSTSYSRQSFTKSQYEQDAKKYRKPINTKC